MNLRRYVSVAVFAVGLAFAGCGDDSPTGGGTGATGGCTTDGGICTDYSKTVFTQSNLQDTCSALAGTFHESGCPSTNRVGTCTYPEDDHGNVSRHHFYSPDHDATTSEAACNMQSGTWSS